jgi:parallel beta-helix repeat protein
MNISKNVVFRNRAHGIYLDSSSSDNRIFHNEICRNLDGNAYDAGYWNMWDDGDSMGNFWSDCPEVGVYQIEGGADSRDRYPMALGYNCERAPIINHPEDIFLNLESYPAVVVQWDVWDSDPERYHIFVNDNLFINETWNGDVVSIELQNLESGTYNITIVLIDTTGYTVSDSIMVSLVGERPIDPGISLTLTELMYIGVLGAEVSAVIIISIFIIRKRNRVLE